jgi:nicotinamidase/pyrazinamidase
MEERNALLVTDIQNDFCPGGALPVQEGDKIIPTINKLMDKFYKIIGTQDWHPENHMSFAKNHPGKNEYDIIDIDGESQVLWPMHCVWGTKGADFHPEIITKKFDIIIRKGNNPKIDSYSAFRENDKKTITGLEGYLKNLGIEQVFLCGLALDYCVFYSAIDSKEIGFETYVILDATRGIDSPTGSIEKALDSMQDNGIKIIESKDVF